MSSIGCPYKTINPETNETEFCPAIRKNVEGFVMCDCDWESCTEYWKMRLIEKLDYRAYQLYAMYAQLADEQAELIGGNL